MDVVTVMDVFADREVGFCGKSVQSRAGVGVIRWTDNALRTIWNTTLGSSLQLTYALKSDKRLDEEGKGKQEQWGDYHVSGGHLLEGKEHTNNDESHNNIQDTHIIFPSPFSTRSRIAAHSPIVSLNFHFLVDESLLRVMKENFAVFANFLPQPGASASRTFRFIVGGEGKRGRNQVLEIHSMCVEKAARTKLSGYWGRSSVWKMFSVEMVVVW